MPKAKAVQHKRARCRHINRGKPGLTPIWLQICQAVENERLEVGKSYGYSQVRDALTHGVSDMESLQFELAEKRCPYLFRTVGKLYRLELRAA